MPSNDHRHHSGELPDPALLLAIRSEIEGALHPVREEMRQGFDGMKNRLAEGRTEIALIKQKQEAQDAWRKEHEGNQALLPKEPKTERRRKEMNPLLMMFLSGALGSLGGLAMVWFLVGIGQQAAKS